MSMYRTALSPNSATLSPNNAALSSNKPALSSNKPAFGPVNAALIGDNSVESDIKINKGISAGTKVTSPAGRLLEVADVFVPRANREKSRTLPSQFRNMNRKIVVFHNGTMAPLKEIQSLYKLVA